MCGRISTRAMLAAAAAAALALALALPSVVVAPDGLAYAEEIMKNAAPVRAARRIRCLGRRDVVPLHPPLH